MGVVVIKECNEWGHVKGTYGKYGFSAKVCDNKSSSGIGRGKRVIKIAMSLQGYGSVLHYDRGWDTRPRTESDKEALDAILSELNSLPILERRI